MNNMDFKVDFIGIADQKSASGWIYQCFRDHPQIDVSDPKETFFFSRDELYGRGIDYYQKFFPKERKGLIMGEYSPAYIHHPESAERIYKAFPEAKLVVCFRNPADKLYSAYWFDKISSMGSKSIYTSFEEALEKDKDFLASGYYFEKLARFFSLFPRERILVMIYEDIEKDPEVFIKRIFSFLGVDENREIPSVHARVNVTGDKRLKYPAVNKAIFRLKALAERSEFGRQIMKRVNRRSLLRFLVNHGVDKNPKQQFKKPPMKPETRQKLNDLFAEDKKKLGELIGRDLSCWK